MSDDEVISRRDGAVLWIQLSNPPRRGALTWRMYDELERLCLAANDDPDLRVVVIGGRDGSFAAGTDIGQFAAFTSGADGVAYEHRIGEIVGALLAVRVPVVGVVEGPAVGGGLSIAACCDLLIATEDARFGVPIAQTLGNVISPAAVQRLRDRLGAGRTMAMLLTSRLLGAAEAQTAGFVHTVVGPDDLEATVTGIVERIAAGAPLTLAAIKELDRRLGGLTALDPADELMASVYGSADFREGVAAFGEKRKPVWTGR
ncbi:enoyl-CoA hydratase [Pseudonocardia nematodicida]|uniref:Enoyl-CoA hydratase n=1 Tax=Pseudonocardia nematodicida TaxID=1206997 RepID=A0ABV1K6E7_9PSEU